MKKALSLLLALVLCLSALPMSAMALDLPALDILEAAVGAVEESAEAEELAAPEPEEETVTVEAEEESETLLDGAGWADVTSYEELLEALGDADIRYIDIIEDFAWPTGPVTLDLNGKEIYVRYQGWTIPAHVTINQYSSVDLIDGQLTINGVWNFMNEGSIIKSGVDNGKVVANGTLTMGEGLDFEPVTTPLELNGVLEYADTLRIGEVLTMGDGAVIRALSEEGSVRIWNQGSITGPATGSARIEGELTIFNELGGNLALDRLVVNENLTITEGAHITVESISSIGREWLPYTIYLNGELSIEPDSEDWRLIEYTTIQLGDRGVLSLNHNVYLYDDELTSFITGTGTLQFSAILGTWTYEYWDDEACDFLTVIKTYVLSAPQLFGVNTGELDRSDPTGTSYVPLVNVADTVTVLRLWDTCEHSLGESTTVEPTCGSEGYDISFCRKCGSECRANTVPPTEEHSVYYTKNNASYVRVRCENCDSSFPVGIEVPEEQSFVANGEPIEPAVFSGATQLEAWGETLPAIVYTDNIRPGTATASATFGGITVSTTFEILAPVLGDVDGGGTANAQDLVLLMRGLVGTETLNAVFADVNGDELVDILDVIALVRLLAQ